MARLYKVSADTSEKEKIIGGILTLQQGGFCAIGLLMIGGIFLMLQGALGPVAALIFALPPGIAFAYLFAFYKKEGLSFATYLIYKNNMDKKTKYLINDYNYGNEE